MPRYFFHVIDGVEMIDNEGTELAGIEEARDEAVVLTGGMLKDAGRKFWNNGEWRLQVTDEVGETVCASGFRPSTASSLGLAGRSVLRPALRDLAHRLFEPLRIVIAAERFLDRGFNARAFSGQAGISCLRFAYREPVAAYVAGQRNQAERPGAAVSVKGMELRARCRRRLP